MRPRFGALVVMASAMSLAGCGSTKLVATDAAGIHAIALTGFAEPKFRIQGRLGLRTFNEKPGGMDDFTAVLEDAGLHLAAELKDAIAQALRDDGYLVDGGAADATLDITIGGAPPNAVPMYQSAFGGYEPEYSVEAVLKNSRTGKTVFHQLYVYRDNSISPVDGTILIRPERQYEFKSRAVFVTDPKHAADGFRAAIPLVAQSIGALLKKS